MVALRLVFGLMLAGGILCFAMYVGTGQRVWRNRGVFVVKWAVVAALVFFAVLILERVAVML